ncbi:hypothetical protein [Lysinibacillus piscis]|uniref:Cell surface protein n=1 Tax=Lysinibacillus piscis TaxID=2518931 RepID=A0ABQ5NFH8_9BACI|nr:hypothetical protein [Lysinibacillus sp. KH24]GLC87129.1 hypothetical protein LYSBPC_02560 [Lysinibacillus sp. KH24]
MLKHVSKCLLGFTVALFAVLSFVANTSAAGTITGNNSFANAYSVGYWKYSNIDTTILPEDEEAAYFKFTLNAGEKVYVKSSYQSQYQGMKIELFDSSQQSIIGQGATVVNPTSLTPFIFAKADATSAQTVYVKVSRGSYTGDMYFTISILERIKSGSGTFNFSGTATNPGNAGLNLNGVDSTVISMDLRNNTTIPRYALVKSITTSSTQTPSQGNVLHKISSEQTNVWYTAIVSNATNGQYTISLQDQLQVAQKWNFKYNAKATAASKMTNVRATVNYEYDVTDQFQY